MMWKVLPDVLHRKKLLKKREEEEKKKKKFKRLFRFFSGCIRYRPHLPINGHEYEKGG